MEVAQIQGGGLVLVVVTATSPLAYSVFLNDRAVPQDDVESLSVSVEISDSGDPVIRATLSSYVVTVSGERSLQHKELFPCTLEMIASGRRLVVTCEDPGSIDSVLIAVGLEPDGAGRKISGARGLRILVTDEILDAKITWVDGEAEDLLPPL
jgi:hypothetical protein